uniref:Uncharacterized protein n=1 Tax=Anopheles atroparvus TaxID=41427 RepID=A0AAG5DHG7_ANOAO
MPCALLFTFPTKPAALTVLYSVLLCLFSFDINNSYFYKYIRFHQRPPPPSSGPRPARQLFCYLFSNFNYAMQSFCFVFSFFFFLSLR